MFQTNWKWISEKKKEEHVHNHSHLFTCLQKTTQVLQHRENIGTKIPHLTFLQLCQSLSVAWAKSRIIQRLDKNGR